MTFTAKLKIYGSASRAAVGATARHPTACIPLAIAWCALGVAVLSRLLYAEYLSVPKWMCILATIPPVVGLYVLP
jgi:hypothetical protein